MSDNGDSVVKTLMKILMTVLKKTLKKTLRTAMSDRREVSVPISPEEEVTDELLLEGAGDAEQKFYIPRYSLAEETVSGKQQVRVQLKQTEQGGLLEVYLNKHPAPAIESAARNAEELEPEKEMVLLKYRTGGAQKERSFQQIEDVEQGMRAGLELGDATELLEITNALSDQDRQAALVVQRDFRVAVPAKPDNDKTSRLAEEIEALEKKEKQQQRKVRRYQARKESFEKKEEDRPRTTVPARRGKKARKGKKKQSEEDRPQHRARARRGKKKKPKVRDHRKKKPKVRDHRKGKPKVRDHRKKKSKSRGRRKKKRSRKALRRVIAQLKTAKEQLHDIKQQRANKEQKLEELQNEPNYRETTCTLEQRVAPEPFSFPLDMDYIYPDIGDDQDVRSGLIRCEVEWEGRQYSYYQDEAERHLFFYLPDRFRLTRRPDPPHYPALWVEFKEGPGALDDIDVDLTYQAVPHVDEDRLEAARSELQQRLPSSLPEGVSEPVLQPLVASEVPCFRLRMPDASANSEGPFVERSQASVHLRDGLEDTVRLPLKSFKAIYTAMMSGKSRLFSGEVLVDLGEGLPTERVPFSSRMSDLAGELFAYDETPDSSTGRIDVMLRSAIESPMEVKDLEVEVYRGEAGAAATIQQVQGPDGETAFPVEMQPGEKIDLQVVSETSLEGEGRLEAVFDLSGVEVSPDPEAIWSAIVDSVVPVKYERPIVLKTIANLFETQSDDAQSDDAVHALLVEFDQGETVELNSDQREAEVTLRLPIRDYLLSGVKEDNGDIGSFQYQVTAIREDGSQLSGPKTTEDDTIIYVTEVPT